MICPNCGKTVADIATTCAECRSVIGPMDPDTQAELIAQRKAQTRSRTDAGSGGPSPGLRGIRFLAMIVTIAVVLAGTAGIPRLTRGRITLAPKSTTIEETIAKAHTRWLSKRRSTNANYLVFIAFMGIAVLAVWQAADALQNVTGQPSGSIVGVTVAVLSTVVLGLFAARLKMEIFRPAGRLDWMMNGMSFAAGVILGVAMNWKRR